MSRVETLQARLQPLYQQLSNHPLYRSLSRVEELRLFMESHVFAVWDFMSLLKTLQRGLTCVDVPWLPCPAPESRRLINEIVLGEESDVYEGMASSHFELYLLAMHKGGASTAAIDALVAALHEGNDVRAALDMCGAPEEAARFVRDTFSLIETHGLHAVAAAFTFGREDLIPDMFRGLVRDLNRDLHGTLSTFVWYLERHIEVDGDEHGPMALRMVSNLCGEDDRKWAEAEEAATFALTARLRLWDGIASRIGAAQPKEQAGHKVLVLQ